MHTILKTCECGFIGEANLFVHHGNVCKKCKKEYDYEYTKCIRKEQPAKAMLARAKERAKERQRPCTIVLKDIQLLLQNMVCAIPFCQKPLIRNPSRVFMNSPTIDEVRCGEGYIPGNIALICFQCNKRKNDFTLQELESMVAWIKGYTS